MAASSVAAVNTSKEATIIRLLRFPAPLSGLVDSFDPPQSRGQLPCATARRLCFAGHMITVESRIGTCGGAYASARRDDAHCVREMRAGRVQCGPVQPA